MAVAEGELDRAAIGSTGTFAQSLAHIAPALGVFFTIPLVAGVVGVVTPVAIGLAGIAMLLVGACVAELARGRPSAGGMPAWIAGALGPRAGFAAGWLMALYEPLVPAINLALLGGVLEPVLEAEYGVQVGWWVWVAGGGVLLVVLGLRGLRPSIRVALGLAVFELVICGALAIHGLASPGPGGFNLTPLDGGEGLGTSGLALGVAFAVFGFAGFESVVPLAEESENPVRDLPRAVLGSIALCGGFLVLASWGVIVGWGTTDIAGLPGDPTPAFTVAQRLWDDAWVILLLALLNSVIAVSIAAQNASTRMLYAAGRSGLLPGAFARTGRTGQPVTAVLVQGALTVAVALAGGALLGPIDVLVLVALVITLVLIVIFTLVGVGVWRRHRGTPEFSVLRHAIWPAGAIGVLGYVGWRSLDPLPPEPAKWAPFVVGAWALAGLAVFVVRRRALASAVGLLVAGAAFLAPLPASAAELVELRTPSRFVDESRVHFVGETHPGELRAKVLLPDGYDGKRRFPILYLLHGLGEAFDVWANETDPRAIGGIGGDIVHTASGFPGIIVMPEGASGWYTNWWNDGMRGDPEWERWLLDELVPQVERTYRIRRGRRWHAVAGFSMGGFGAFHLAAQRPEAFGTAASFSGQLSLYATPDFPDSPALEVNMGSAFGPRNRFYRDGHDPVQSVAGLRHTRLFVSAGDGTPQAGDPSPPDGLLLATALERNVRPATDAFLAAAYARRLSVKTSLGAGLHSYWYARQRLREAIRWGLFGRVPREPNAWEYRTVAERGNVWRLSYSFPKPPSGVVTLERRGDRLLGLGTGRIRVRAPGGRPRLRKLPFDVRYPSR